MKQRRPIRKIGIQEVIEIMIPKLQSQLRAVSNELKQCEVTNNSLLLKIDKKKLKITTSERNIQFLEDVKEKIIEMLVDKDEKISLLESLIQKIEDRIIK